MTDGPPAAAEARDSDRGAEDAQPGILPSGSGYRAVVSRDGMVAWSCPHVHFTDHSARACAERRVAEEAAPR